MASYFITPEGRAVYVQVASARVSNLNPNGSPKYTIKVGFAPDSPELKAMKAEASRLATAQWGANIPKNLRSPFRVNSELDSPISGIPDDWIVMSFSCNEDRGAPGCVNSKNQRIMDTNELYSGMWCRVQVNGFTYDKAGNKGVSFGLQNIQKTRDDEPLGGARPKAESVFEPVDGDTDEAPNPSAVFD